MRKIKSPNARVWLTQSACRSDASQLVWYVGKPRARFCLRFCWHWRSIFNLYRVSDFRNRTPHSAIFGTVLYHDGFCSNYRQYQIVNMFFFLYSLSAMCAFVTGTFPRTGVSGVPPNRNSKLTGDHWSIRLVDVVMSINVGFICSGAIITGQKSVQNSLQSNITRNGVN